jgi:hypothetical protein
MQHQKHWRRCAEICPGDPVQSKRIARSALRTVMQYTTISRRKSEWRAPLPPLAGWSRMQRRQNEMKLSGGQNGEAADQP